MTSGDPLQADTTDAPPDDVLSSPDTAMPQDQADVTVKKGPVEPSDHVADDAATDVSESPDSVSHAEEPAANATETRDDDAWIEACRTEAGETVEAEEPSEPPQTDEEAAPSNELGSKKVLLNRIETLSDSIVTLSGDVETLRSQADESDNEAALTELSNRLAAIEKTGDDAMSKFGHAIGAVAERDDDLEDRGMEYAAEVASPSRTRESDVAPYIANAERELERSKSSGPVDIFDRIAQAAESQFEETRGSAAKRVSELVDDRRVGTKRWTPSKTMRQRMEKLEAARAAATATAATTAAATASGANVTAASAPTSSTATMVSPGAAAAKTEQAEKPEAAAQEQETVVISRRDRQDAKIEAEEKIETASDGASDSAAEHEEEDVDGLRVVPGARGRRRDRARKSRLDEDFEKIFDDEGKPSIGSLRRKLRTASTSPEDTDAETQDASIADASDTKAQAGQSDEPKAGLFSRLMKPKGKTVEAAEEPVAATMTEEDFGAEPAAEPKRGLLSRFSKAKKPAADTKTEEELVAAFEADESLSETFDLGTVESAEDDGWETAAIEGSGKTSALKPLLVGVFFAALGGLGFYLYKFGLGG